MAKQPALPPLGPALGWRVPARQPRVGDAATVPAVRATTPANLAAHRGDARPGPAPTVRYDQAPKAGVRCGPAVARGRTLANSAAEPGCSLQSTAPYFASFGTQLCVTKARARTGNKQVPSVSCAETRCVHGAKALHPIAWQHSPHGLTRTKRLRACAPLPLATQGSSSSGRLVPARAAQTNLQVERQQQARWPTRRRRTRSRTHAHALAPAETCWLRGERSPAHASRSAAIPIKPRAQLGSLTLPPKR